MKIKVEFVNVGYGEAIVIEQFSHNELKPDYVAIIDGGSNEDVEYDNSSTGRMRLIDYLQKKHVKQVDLMVATHPHEDHVSGLLPVVHQYPVKELWQMLTLDTLNNMDVIDEQIFNNSSRKKFVHALNDSKQLVELTKKRGGRIRTVRPLTGVRLTDEISVDILAPYDRELSELNDRIRDLFEITDLDRFKKEFEILDGELNNYSITMRLSICGKTFLLPGDRNGQVLDNMRDKLVHTDVFKIGHHGQADGLNSRVLDILSPGIIVCCASSDRRYGSANNLLISEAKARNIRLIFTDGVEVGDDGCHCASVFLIEPLKNIAFEYERRRKNEEI